MSAALYMLPLYILIHCRWCDRLPFEYVTADHLKQHIVPYLRPFCVRFVVTVGHPNWEPSRVRSVQPATVAQLTTVWARSHPTFDVNLHATLATSKRTRFVEILTVSQGHQIRCQINGNLL